MKAVSPFLTATEAAAYLRFSTVGAFRAFLCRRRKAGFPVPSFRRNRTLLFKEADLVSALDEQKPRLRRVG